MDLIECLALMVVNFEIWFNFFLMQSGLRLFGFIGAGATLGQLFGSLFATGMAWLGPRVYLFMFFLASLFFWGSFTFYFLSSSFFGSCRFTSCFSNSHGTCCTIIKRDQERCLTISWRTISLQVFFFLLFLFYPDRVYYLLDFISNRISPSDEIRARGL